jgi:hypothetical protein
MLPFLSSIPDYQWARAARDGPIYDDDLSSLREKLFIGFFPPCAEYYSQTNGWGIHMKVHGDSPFSIHRGGIEDACP